jgi:hypothetical protein
MGTVGVGNDDWHYPGSEERNPTWWQKSRRRVAAEGTAQETREPWLNVRRLFRKVAIWHLIGKDKGAVQIVSVACLALISGGG